MPGRLRAKCAVVECHFGCIAGSDYCGSHTSDTVYKQLKAQQEARDIAIITGRPEQVAKPVEALATKYPKYYKSTQGKTEVDVYAVHKIFDIQDASGAIQHASKKLLLSGVRTGNKSKRQDIAEARDTLNRWLELNPE